MRAELENMSGRKLTVKCFVREKKIYCGSDFLAVDIFRYTSTQCKAVKGKRSKKVQETAPKQRDLNDKRAKRYFVQLGNTNFGKGDLVAHLTYTEESLPETPEAAHKIVTNFLRRVDYHRKAKGLAPLKYLLVTQYGRKKNGTHRIHHHIIMNGGLDRDFVESLWWKKKVSKKQPAVMYGWANVDRLKPNEKGISELCGYMMKNSAGKKHWTQSQNLEKPWSRSNDSRYSGRTIEKICKIPKDAEAYASYWEKKYPGYKYIDSDREYNDLSGWSVYLVMRRNC